ncbi:MAG: RraA family protein [Sphingomonadaceae bacterium]
MEKFGQRYYDQIEEKLYTAVLADTMDDMGYRNQVMRYDIRPLYPEAKIVGRAATMLGVQAYTIPAEPYKLELALLDDLKPGEVVLCTMQGPKTSSVWGELLSTHTRAKGGRGAIIDGLTRDAWGIIAMKFPVFATGLTPADSKGRCDIISIRQPIEVGGVIVHDGDLVFADQDGCLAIPQAIEDEVIAQAMEKVTGENKVRELLSRGASIQQVFRDFGIL